MTTKSETVVTPSTASHDKHTNKKYTQGSQEIHQFPNKFANSTLPKPQKGPNTSKPHPTIPPPLITPIQTFDCHRLNIPGILNPMSSSAKRQPRALVSLRVRLRITRMDVCCGPPPRA